MSASKLSRVVLLATALVGGGCGRLRFADRPCVWQVDDKRPIAEPKSRDYLVIQYFADVFAMRRLERALALPDLEPAHDVNSMEEVPDSTWFENRIGRRTITPEEAARGPATKPAPRPPFVIQKGKVGGGALGFIMKDADGRSFLVKFDRKENPEMQTGTNVIVNRFFWAFGYHVPADYVFDLRRSDISISPKATAKNDFGDDVPYDEARLEEALAAGPPPKGGVYRATASEFLSGKPMGGFPAEGTRPDDPNDVVPHEHRRELRGLRVLAAFLNHTDMKEDNTLDMYEEHEGRHYLVHYFVDFGEALGGHGAEKLRKEDGYEHFWDWENQSRALVSLGLWTRPWEGLKPSGYAAIGIFSAEAFDPSRWREAYPYWPFMEMDATDAFWAAKIVMRFSRDHIAAIVHEGRLTEPGAEAYLARVLEQRRDAIGETFLEALSPLDDLEIEGRRLCATDLGVGTGLRKYGVLERLVEGRVVESRDIGAAARACVSLPETRGYAVVTLRSRRGDVTRPPMEVHLMLDERPRILGIVRDPR